MQNKAQKLWIIFFAILLIPFIMPCIIQAMDDDVPFFAGDTGNPNVFFIFDNSDSMQDCPYLRINGNTYRPWTYWRRGVVIENGHIKEDANGNIVYDNGKYITTSNVLTLPGTNPPNLPGLSSRSSTVTKIISNSSNRIYDTNVDWTDSSINSWTAFSNNYRWWKVKIKDANGAEQIRTIYSYSSSGYWRVDRNIDYSGPEPYTYELMTGFPGTSTYRGSSHLDRLYDRYFDWSTISGWTDFSTNYRWKILEITDGTNKGEKRQIYSYSTSDKYWRLNSPLPQACDYTTHYRILGSNDDNRYATGGNHPDSKLYKAKKALNTFLNSNAIRDGNGKYLLNMGFATYMSARIPRVCARYYRKHTYNTQDRCRAYYYRWADTHKDCYDPDGPANGYDIDAWGVHHEDVSIGDQIDRPYGSGCTSQTIHYKVTEISPSPTDSLPNRYRIRLRSNVGVSNEGGYRYYNWIYFDDVTDCSGCAGYAYPDPYIEGSHTWHRATACDLEYAPGCVSGSSGWYYESTWHDTYGDYGITDSGTPGYVDPVTGAVTVSKGYCSGSGWSCTNPDPDVNWTLVPEGGITGPVNSSGATGTITRIIFDNSYFRYPGEGTDDRPHAWSNRRAYYNGNINNRWIYQYSSWKHKAKWRDDMQPSEVFPADVGNDNANRKGDDQVIFVNLPYDVINGAVVTKDDENGNNINIIKNYINLSRVPYPKDTRYVKTMMPYTNSLAVNSSQAVTGKGTPLGATLENALAYYRSYISQDSYSQGECRNNYIILLTDGLETCDGDPVSAAAALYNLSVNNRPTPVKTYVIGFGLDDASKASLNAIAAAGGTTHAYYATDVDELVSVLTNDIMGDIVSDSYTRSAPTVTSLREGDTIANDLKIYYTYFDYPIWKGHLKGYKINADGSIGNKLPGWAGDCDSDSGPDADAGCEMKENGRGTVYTVVNGGREEFSTANLSDLKSLVNPDGDDIDGDGTANTDADATAVINYTLDPGYDSGKYVGSRDADWPLGDIYHSVPVVVTKPNFDSAQAGYSAFKAAHASRETMLYVGANDGMLHAIHESNGQEAWAWIPNCILGKLHEFKEGHRFTVDLPIKAADINIGTDASPDWRTMVVCGLRQGGKYYFAIDVTDPSDPQFMWEITDDSSTDSSAPGFPGADIPGDMGQTWSIPAFGRININGVPTSVIFVGGGYSTSENVGNRIYILDAGTGKIIKELPVGTSSNNVPSEIRNMRFLDINGSPVDYLTRSPVDSSLDGFIEVSYFGGTDGRLYKLTGLNADSGWNPQVKTLYVPEHPRPIYYRPAVWDLKCVSGGRRFVLFGTGDENDPTNSTSVDYFYEIEDRAYDNSEGGFDDGSPCTAQDIADGRFRLVWQYWHLADPDDQNSAHIDGFPAGEKVLSYPTAYRGVVYFTTYQSTGGCGMGTSNLYGLTVTTKCSSRPDNVDCGGYQDGGGEGGLEYDINNNPLDPHKKFISLGKGIASSPVVAPPTLYIQVPKGGGGGMRPPLAISIPTDQGKLLYWRDIN